MKLGGREKQRGERSQLHSFFLHFCSSQCQKQSRPDLDVPHMGIRPSPLRDRGDNDSGDGGVTELLLEPRLLTMQQGAPDRPEKTQIL